MKLSLEEAFKIMTYFLEKYYDRAPSDDIGTLLSSMIMIDDNQKTSDPALWQDFLEAVNVIISKR